MGRGRAPCCDKTKVRTGPWSPAEDLRLMNFIQKHGHSNWRALPKQAGLQRCGKSCRLRWINYLRPDVKRGNFTPEEENTIIQLHNSIGNKWSKIASCLPGRTDNEIKNVWNTHLKKRLKKTAAADHNCPKMDSSTTPPDENVEKLLENPRFLEENACMDDSPSSSCLSNLSNGSKQALLDSKLSEATSDPQIDKSDVATSDFDGDFWELLDSLDPLQPNRTPQADAGDTNLSINVEGKVEVGRWLRFLENELGLANDGDHLPENPKIYQDIIQPEFTTAFVDFSAIWPAHHYLGI